MMEGSVGLGALVAALVVAGMGIFRNKGRIMIAVIIIYSLLVSMFALSPFFPLSLILLALSGIAWSGLNALNSTLIQMASPDEYRGRSLQRLHADVLAAVDRQPRHRAAGRRLWRANSDCRRGVLAAVLSLGLAWLNPRMRGMD